MGEDLRIKIRAAVSSIASKLHDELVAAAATIDDRAPTEDELRKHARSVRDFDGVTLYWRDLRVIRLHLPANYDLLVRNGEKITLNFDRVYLMRDGKHGYQENRHL